MTTPSGNNGPTPKPKPSFAEGLQNMKPLVKTPQFIWIIHHLGCLIASFLFFITGKMTFYRLAFISTFISYLVINAIKYGSAKGVLSHLLDDENILYMVLSGFWLILTFIPGKSVTVGIIPFLIYAGFHWLSYFRAFVLPCFGYEGSSWISVRIGDFLRKRNDSSMFLAATVELLTLFRLFFAAIRGIFSLDVVSLFILYFYVVFVKLRYDRSRFMNIVVNVWESRVDRFFNTSPYVPLGVKNQYIAMKPKVLLVLSYVRVPKKAVAVKKQ